MHNHWEEVGTEVAIVFSYIYLNRFIGLINEIENIRFPGKTWILSGLYWMRICS